MAKVTFKSISRLGDGKLSYEMKLDQHAFEFKSGERTELDTAQEAQKALATLSGDPKRDKTQIKIALAQLWLVKKYFNSHKGAVEYDDRELEAMHRDINGKIQSAKAFLKDEKECKRIEQSVTEIMPEMLGTKKKVEPYSFSNFMKPDSVTVRYGTTIATCGRAIANTIMIGSLTPYAIPAIASNVTGLAFNHDKPGVAAESGLALVALSFLGANGIATGNWKQIWMAGVGMWAFGNAFAKNIRYTKACPKPFRLYQDKEKQAQEKLLLKPNYDQTHRTNGDTLVQEKAPRDAWWKKISPVIWLRKQADKMAQSENEKTAMFGEDAAEITRRPMVAAGMLAITGVTPFMVDGVQHGLKTGDWTQAIGGGIIFLANAVSMVSIPQKQKHPVVALVHEVTDRLTGKKRNPNVPQPQ